MLSGMLLLIAQDGDERGVRRQPGVRAVESAERAERAPGPPALLSVRPGQRHPGQRNLQRRVLSIAPAGQRRVQPAQITALAAVSAAVTCAVTF